MQIFPWAILAVCAQAEAAATYTYSHPNDVDDYDYESYRTAGLGLDTKAATVPAIDANTTVQENETAPSEMNVVYDYDDTDSVPGLPLLPQSTVGGLNIFDLLKMAVVESNVDHVALERQARKHEQRKKLVAQQARKREQRKSFSQQENPNSGSRPSPSLSEVSVVPTTPWPALAVKRVTPSKGVRSRHSRFSSSFGTEDLETPEMTESSTVASSTSSGRTRRRRIQSRTRGQPSAPTATDTAAKSLVTTQLEPTTTRSRVTARRRIPLGRSSRVQGGAKKKKVTEQEINPKATEGNRTRISRIRTVTRRRRKMPIN